MSTALRVLFAHAHPDDESITTGGTIAALVAEGADVTVLTATRGEGGEVMGSEHAALEGDRSGLAAHREGELADAMRALGVTDHRFLGTAAGGASAGGEAAEAGSSGLPERRFEDSGMEWGSDGHAQAPASMPEAALCAAPLEDVAAYVGAVIDEVRPQLVVTYAEGGGYGHPDHVRVHDAVREALRTRATRADGTDAIRMLCIVNTAESVAAAFDPTAPGFDLTGFEAAETPTTIADDVPLAASIDVEDVLGAKAMAMAAHGTQIAVAGEFFALSNRIGTRIGTREEYALCDPEEGIVAFPGGPFDSLTPLAPSAREPEPHSAESLAAAADPSTSAALGGAAAAAATGAAASQAGERTAEAETASADSGQRLSPESEPDRGGPWAWAHAVLIGVCGGVLGSLQHLSASVVEIAGQSVIVPWGLLLALTLAAFGIWHVATMHRSVVAAVVTGAIMSLIAFALGQPAIWPGADLIVTGSKRSLVWLFGPMLIAAVFAFALPSLRRRQDSGGRPSNRPTSG